MTRFLLIICGVLFLWACKPGIPNDVMQPDEMEKILFDIHLVDGYISSIPTPDSAKKVSAPIYKGIFKKYGTDSATHAKSMAYYYKRPDLLTKIYNNISQRLIKVKEEETKRQAKIGKLMEKKAQERERKIADSIKKVQEKKKADSLKKLAANKPLKAIKTIKK